MTQYVQRPIYQFFLHSTSNPYFDFNFSTVRRLSSFLYWVSGQIKRSEHRVLTALLTSQLHLHEVPLVQIDTRVKPISCHVSLQNLNSSSFVTLFIMWFIFIMSFLLISSISIMSPCISFSISKRVCFQIITINFWLTIWLISLISFKSRSDLWPRIQSVLIVCIHRRCLCQTLDLDCASNCFLQCGSWIHRREFVSLTLELD